MDLIDLVQDRDQWGADMNTVGLHNLMGNS
jgi:hypothetical protein